MKVVKFTTQNNNKSCKPHSPIIIRVVHLDSPIIMKVVKFTPNSNESCKPWFNNNNKNCKPYFTNNKNCKFQTPKIIKIVKPHSPK